MRCIPLLCLLLLTLSSCHFIGSKRIRGNGVMATEQKSVGAFSGVQTKGGVDIIVIQGDSHSLKLEGDENLLKYIQVTQNGDMMVISTPHNTNLSPRAGLRVYATAPTFTKLYIAGSGDLKSENSLHSSSPIEAKIDGSGDIVLTIDAPTVSASIAGSGDIRLSGTTRNFQSRIVGSGDIKCFDLLSESADVDIAGAGDVQVSASKQLSIDIKGAGDVQYKGNPVINKSIKGAGSVTKAG